MSNLRGIFPATVTPYDKSGTFDPVAMRKVIGHQLRAGVHGFYLCGGTGEGLLLKREEHRAVVETVIDEVGGKVPVISHVGAFQTDGALGRAEDARNAGVDAISALPPAYFYTPDEKEIVHYYRKLAEAAALPLLIYNIPARTGVTMTTKLYEDLLNIDDIIGMKDSTGDLFAIGKFIAQRPEATLFNGEDTVLLGGLMAGACGGIGLTYNLMPRWFVQLWDAVQDGNMAEAAELQEKINKCISILLNFNLIAAAKQMMAWIGLECGVPRTPLRELEDDEKIQLRKNLENTGYFEQA